MDDDHVVVFDVVHRKVVAAIPAPGVHGVLAVPALHRVFASATNARELYTIDERTNSVVARTSAGEYPDGIAWDPVERHIFVSDETGGVETVANAAGRRIATIRLGGEAGNVQYDPAGHGVLVDVQTRNVLAVVDPRRNRIVQRVALPGRDHDHGLQVDTQRRLAFIACDGNARLLTVDLRTLRTAAVATVGPSPDVLAFDDSLRRLYVAAESGEIAVFAEHGRRLTKLGEAELAPEAHTVAVDPRTHFVYFPLQSGTGGRPELRIMKPA
jgi:DNA-binding beta-propeller fold protein YncE